MKNTTTTRVSKAQREENIKILACQLRMMTRPIKIEEVKESGRIEKATVLSIGEKIVSLSREGYSYMHNGFKFFIPSGPGRISLRNLEDGIRKGTIKLIDSEVAA